MRELIPEWMMSTNSNRFHSNHLSTNPRDLFWKTRHTKISQQVKIYNSDCSIDLRNKEGENIQTWSNLCNIYSGGYWSWNESAGHGMQSNPATYCPSDSRYKQYHSHGYLKYGPFCHIFAIMRTCTAEGAGEGMQCASYLEDLHCNNGTLHPNQCRKGWMSWMGWKGFSNQWL